MASKTVYLDDQTLDILQRMCKQDMRTPSNLVQYLVGQEWLRRHAPTPSPSLKEGELVVDDGWHEVKEYVTTGR